MPLYVYRSLLDSGRVPITWRPLPRELIKYPVRNRELRKYLNSLLPGGWRKVIQKGNIGEAHYFQHESGAVAGVKFFAEENGG